MCDFPIEGRSASFVWHRASKEWNLKLEAVVFSYKTQFILWRAVRPSVSYRMIPVPVRFLRPVFFVPYRMCAVGFFATSLFCMYVDMTSIVVGLFVNVLTRSILSFVPQQEEGRTPKRGTNTHSIHRESSNQPAASNQQAQHKINQSINIKIWESIINSTKVATQ